jgi:hypothetical protein
MNMGMHAVSDLAVIILADAFNTNYKLLSRDYSNNSLKS